MKKVEKDMARERAGCVIREGNPCPNCREGRLEMNGLLALVCPVCGTEFGGSFT